jgi:hypothetical protein
MDEKDVEKIKELIKETKPRSPKETYQKDIADYIYSKLEGFKVPDHTIMEIAQYCAYQTALVLNDEIWKAQRVWQREWDRAMRKSNHRPQ